jgi:alpha-tubulin suppressor-like RCC1 family protein
LTCGTFNEEVMELVEILEPKDVEFVDIACGWTHNLALSKDGSVYSWGLGLYGSLGHGDTANKNLPEKIEILDGMKVVQVQCGVWHSAVLTESGDVYTFGLNHHGQLGIGLAKAMSATPELVDIEANDDMLSIKHISCGSRHTVALTMENQVFGWGWNKKKQLGRNDQPEIVELPVQIVNETQGVKWIKAGHWSTVIIASS